MRCSTAALFPLIVLLLVFAAGFGGTRAFSPAVAAPAASLVVTTHVDEDDGTSDPGAGTGTSLREALAYANTLAGPATITFDASLAGATIALELGQLTVTDDVEIDGETGLGGLGITVDAQQQSRVFEIAAGADATLVGLTITGGWSDNSQRAGGIRNWGALTLRRCTVAGNTAASFDADGDTVAACDAGAVEASAAELPVELSSFTAARDGEAVVLRWETASETNNAGFEVQHTALPGSGSHHADAAVGTRYIVSLQPDWHPLAFVEGHGTTVEAQAYAHRVDGLAPGVHRFRLKQVDYDGAFEYSPEVEVEVEAPRELALLPNYPNPFNPQTTIPFTVPADGPAVVVVYDGLGRVVATLFDGVAEAGRRYEVAFEAGGLASGLYVCVLRHGGSRLARPLTLLK